MQTLSHATSLAVLISTILILFFSLAIIYFLFLYQKKRFRHQQEIIELREAFGQTLLQSKLDIQEQTLDHIAKELHANFSHLVSLININLSEILPQSPAAQRENIIETKSLAKQLMSELKALSAALNTDHIAHIGFVNALENELSRLRKTGRYEVAITKSGDEYRLPPEHEIILFRLCQEVLNNVVKYAGASKVDASLHFSPDHLQLTIADNGSGFNVAEARSQSAEKQSTGLLNIEKRAALIGAIFTIDSGTDQGTIATIQIPHPNKLKTVTL